MCGKMNGWRGGFFGWKYGAFLGWRFEGGWIGISKGIWN